MADTSPHSLSSGEKEHRPSKLSGRSDNQPSMAGVRLLLPIAIDQFLLESSPPLSQAGETSGREGVRYTDYNIGRKEKWSKLFKGIEGDLLGEVVPSQLG